MSEHESAVLMSMLSRRSIKLVTSPGPNEQQLTAALSAAVCAPDHARLRVWRFAFLRQPDILALGEQAISILEARGKPMPSDKQAATRAWLADIPLLAAMAYRTHHDHPKVPDIEQSLSMGAAVMGFQQALHAMGFATFWSTGLAIYTEEMSEYLGFDPLDYRAVGFLSIGTPKNAPAPAERPDPWSVARWWTPKSAAP